MVAYTIKQSNEEAIGRVQQLVQECLVNCTGFVSLESMVSLKDPNLLVDIITWENEQNLKDAQTQFESHEQFPELMKHLDEMKFSSYFLN